MSIAELEFNLMKYGGIELKKNYRKYLADALVIAVVVHLVFLFAFWIAQHMGETESKAMPMVHMKLSDLAPPPSMEQTMQQPVSVAEPVAKPSVGVPVPVPDAEVSPEQTIATLNQLTQSGPVGDSVGTGGSGVNVIPEAPIEATKESESTDDPYAFVDVEKEPEMVTSLKTVLQYPELARKAGLEGSVTLRFQVMKDGTVGNVIVEKTDQQIFNQAAIDAIKKCRFTPAIQNKEPIAVWTDQVIKFKLK